MAFHVSCPITCRRICDCSLGFPRELRTQKGKNGFLEEIDKLKAFLNDPWLTKDEKKTVQVLVPKVVPAPAIVSRNDSVVDGSGGDATEETASERNKRAVMQKKAVAASVVAEDFARRFESVEDAVGIPNDLAGEEQVPSNSKVMCRLCYSGENERSERARKMLSCKSCNKKYHMSCLKSWAHNRDLFHWSSWNCPSCRICEVCRRTGDPNKLMFCKRCDASYHCYCQQPPHKNVSKGPYLCPKHTRCHSCSSTVPGNGLSLRWFLGYTCCDACGRLFVKGNYCPVCLKVYRDSESTPMVCCDICQRWVHCHCDGISDEKYLQFQVDNNLQYSCATCRGECYQVRDLEDAVQELWRRRDEADQDLIASLRAAAGLPIQEEIFSIAPYSDEDDNIPALKNEYGHSLKFSLKGVVDKSPKKIKGYVKKSANKKYGNKKGSSAPIFRKIEPQIEGYSDAQSIGSITGDSNKYEDVQSGRFPVGGSLTGGLGLVDRAEVLAKTGRGTFGDETNKKHSVKLKNTKGPKLVIHLGPRNKNVANSPRSDASNSLPEQALTTSNGSEDMDQQRPNDKRLEVKPPLKLKFKNPYSDNQSLVKGQRSKRKRSLGSMDKPSFVKEDKVARYSYEDKNMMDAKWIIQKLGKNAIGKMVEVHQASNNSWHKGTIIDVFEDTSIVSVTLDDGKAINVDLGKQGIRFVSQKQR